MNFERLEELAPWDIWGATRGGYQFVISQTELGYAASWTDSTHKGKQSAKEIDLSFDKPFPSFKLAEAACEKKYAELRKKMS